MRNHLFIVLLSTTLFLGCDPPKAAAPAKPKPGDVIPFDLNTHMVYFPDGERGMRRVVNFRAVPEAKMSVAFASNPNSATDPGGVWLPKDDGASIVFVTQSDYDGRLNAFQNGLFNADQILITATDITKSHSEQKMAIDLVLAKDPVPNDTGFANEACFKHEKRLVCVPPQGMIPAPGLLTSFPEGMQWTRAKSITHDADNTTFTFDDGQVVFSRTNLSMQVICGASTTYDSMSRFDTKSTLGKVAVFAPGSMIRLEALESKGGYPKFLFEHHTPKLGAPFTRATVFPKAKTHASSLADVVKDPKGTQIILAPGRTVFMANAESMKMFEKAKVEQGIPYELPQQAYIDETQQLRIPLKKLPTSTAVSLAKQARYTASIATTVCPSPEATHE